MVQVVELEGKEVQDNQEVLKQMEIQAMVGNLVQMVLAQLLQIMITLVVEIH
jgi:hypothetical protein